MTARTFILAVIAALAAAAPLHAQSWGSGPMHPRVAGATGDSAVPATVIVPARRILATARPVVLPEGTFLIRSPGQVYLDPAERQWLFLPDEFGPDRSRGVPLLPNTALADVAAAFAAQPEDARFPGMRVELTGEFLRYRGRNFLLADAITPARRLTAPSAPEEPAAEGAAAPAAPATQGSDDAAEIERRLRERIGAVPRSLDPGGSDGASPALSPSVQAQEAVGGAASLLVRRRGAVVRDSVTGGWRFVSVTENGGVSEPALRIVPSVALEQIEAVVRSSDSPVPILLSGQVMRFEGQGYLRVTEWRLPRTGKGLAPGVPVGG